MGGDDDNECFDRARVFWGRGVRILGLGCLVQGLGFVFGFGGLGLRVRFPMISSVGCTIKSETRNSISGAHDFSVNRDLFFFL